MARPLHLIFVALLLYCTACRSTLEPRSPAGPHVRVLTYNINWGGPRPDAAVNIIRDSQADIVCLQETTPDWEAYLRATLHTNYPFAEFRYSPGRMGGGLAFLSRLPASTVAYIRSDTGWFDGWIAKFDSRIGPVQVLNVHLHPPVSESGSWTSGYLFTQEDRLREVKRFYSQCAANIPTLVAGDFNDNENSAAVSWLISQGLTNALPLFDRRTPTWEWPAGVVTLRRRMDHIVFSRELRCCSAQVIRAGASDHFPVEAIFEATHNPL